MSDSTPPPGSKPGRPAKRRVLIVVPDLFFATRIAATAKTLGVEFAHVLPAAALEHCAEIRPDLVLIDLQAAGDPVALGRALKQDPRTASIPLLGFYSHVEVELREAALAAGIDQVLPRSAFTARLAELLAGS